ARHRSAPRRAEAQHHARGRRRRAESAPGVPAATRPREQLRHPRRPPPQPHQVAVSQWILTECAGHPRPALHRLSNPCVLDYLPVGGGLGAIASGPSRAGEMAPQKSDRDLVDAAKAGDAEAFGVFVRRHQRRVFRLAVHLLHNAAEAEDISQEAFVRAYGALARFDGRSEPFTWLYRITVNLSLNALRSRKTRRSGVTTDDPRVEAVLVERRPGLADPARQATDRE